MEENISLTTLPRVDVGNSVVVVVMVTIEFPPEVTFVVFPEGGEVTGAFQST